MFTDSESGTTTVIVSPVWLRLELLVIVPVMVTKVPFGLLLPPEHGEELNAPMLPVPLTPFRVLVSSQTSTVTWIEA